MSAPPPLPSPNGLPPSRSPVVIPVRTASPGPSAPPPATAPAPFNPFTIPSAPAPSGAPGVSAAPVPPAPAASRSGLGMGLGIGALATAFIPCVHVVAFVLGGLGLFFSVSALRKAPAGGRTKAVLGTCFSGAALAVALICTIVTLALLDDWDDENDWYADGVTLADYQVAGGDCSADYQVAGGDCSADDDKSSEPVSREEAAARFIGGLLEYSAGMDTPDSQRAFEAVRRSSPELMFETSLLEALSGDYE